MIIAVVGYSITTAPGVRTQPGYNAVLDGWLQNSILMFAAVIVGLRAWRVTAGRVAWGCIGMGLALYATGNIVYFTYVQYQASAPSPSAADFAWLACYPFLYVGVFQLARQRTAGRGRLLRLDSAISALGLSAVAMIWFRVMLDGTHGSTATVLTTMAYPVGDLLFVLILIGSLALTGWRLNRVWAWLGSGICLFAAADTIYAVRVATNSYQAGTLLDPMWAVAVTLIAIAAWQPEGRAPGIRTTGWAVLVVPGLFMATALALLAIVGHGVGSLPIRALALSTVLAGLARAAFTFREMRALVVNGVEARTDELSGLGNRRAFIEAVEQRAAEGQGRFSVMLIDLDRFKEVNDSLGHLAGDRLLHEVGSRLQARMRDGDTLARLGGDEFAILLDNTSPEDAHTIAERLRVDLQKAFVSDGMTIYSDASCGIAVWPDAARTVGGLLQRADIAMYEAKRERLGTAIYSHVGEADLSAPLRLVEELREALANDQLVLFFQPKLDLQTDSLDGVEALVRWQHPGQGLMMPDQFLPQAERYGLMRRLTTSVLTLALDQLVEWRAAGLTTAVAVNISASNLLDVGLPEQIRILLQVRSLPPSCLTLEVTETTLMIDPTRATELLDRLQGVGVRISIDDYGTGYSSLARLRHMPVNELKLARSFLAGIGSDARATSIVRSTVELAHSLGLTLVAEGIETADDETILRELSCDLGQGYHLARPMPGSNLLAWIAEREKVTTLH